MSYMLTSHFFSVLIAFALFGAMHSIFAIPAVRVALESRLRLSAKRYRLLYNIASAILLALIYVVVPPDPAILYVIAGLPGHLLRALQVVAVVLFVRGLRDFNSHAFLGLSPPGADDFNTGGLFRYCRHPLYSTSILFLIANPVMTIGWAAYSMSIILYFIIGSIFEEHHLEKRFGHAYRAYKKKVPRFVPKLSRSG